MHSGRTTYLTLILRILFSRLDSSILRFYLIYHLNRLVLDSFKAATNTAFRAKAPELGCTSSPSLVLSNPTFDPVQSESGPAI
jgi:hypothetical protein